jgi:hypothetical protein
MTTPLEAEGHQSLKAESDSPVLNGVFDDHPDNLPAHSTDRPRTNGQKETAAISPDTPDELDEFDWQDFEARYKAALLEANEEEKAILKEAESLSQVRNTASICLASSLKVYNILTVCFI